MAVDQAGRHEAAFAVDRLRGGSDAGGKVLLLAGEDNSSGAGGDRPLLHDAKPRPPAIAGDKPRVAEEGIAPLLFHLPSVLPAPR